MRNEKMAANAGGMQTESDSGQFYTGRQDVAANDAGLPAVRGWGRYIQRRSKNESWEFVAAEDWSERQQQLQPLYASALEIDGEFSDDVPPLYRGDMYLDWDVGSPDEFGYCINDVNEFLDKLKTDYGVKLECLRIYATGGRGFHVEIPWSVYRADNWEKGAPLFRGAGITISVIANPARQPASVRQLPGHHLDTWTPSKIEGVRDAVRLQASARAGYSRIGHVDRIFRQEDTPQEKKRKCKRCPCGYMYIYTVLFSYLYPVPIKSCPTLAGCLARLQPSLCMFSFFLVGCLPDEISCPRVQKPCKPLW